MLFQQTVDKLLHGSLESRAELTQWWRFLHHLHREHVPDILPDKGRSARKGLIQEDS